MKKVIFIVSVLGLLWGCKKEKVEPVDAPQSDIVNPKIVYSIYQVEGSPVLGKSTYKWNESGRLLEMSSYIDSNNTGYRLYEKRNLEYNGKYVAQYTLSNFNKDGSLYSEWVNQYLYQDGKMFFYTSNNKSFNSGSSFHDYINSYTAQYSNDSLHQHVNDFYNYSSISGNYEKESSDTTMVEYLSKNNSKREVNYNNSFNNGLIRSKTKVLLDKNLRILNLSYLVTEEVALNPFFTIEFTELNDPLSDLVFLGTGTTFWARSIDDWLSDLDMNKLYKRVRDNNKTVYNYEHIINSNGLLTKTNVIAIDSSGNSKMNSTTYFY